MKKAVLFLLGCLLIAVSGDDAKTVSSTTSSITAVTAETTKLTTPTINTTSAAPTTRTTSAAPTTPPSTTKPTSTSTTPTPTTPAPVPTPVPEPQTGSWVVNGTDKKLIIVKMAGQIDIKYLDEKNMTHIKSINIPTSKDLTVATAESFTEYGEALKLSWKSAGIDNNSAVFHFKRDNQTYSLDSISVTIQPQELVEIKYNTSIVLEHAVPHFNTSLGNSYRCVRLQTFNLTNENDKNITGHLKVSDLQFQAFKTDNKTSFGYANDCALETPDIVPIAVGCVLAGLVVIVLAAYLVTRRRSQVRGYLSM